MVVARAVRARTVSGVIRVSGGLVVREEVRLPGQVGAVRVAADVPPTDAGQGERRTHDE
ncbi:hypothetical protein GA0070558_11424 [Micromonospora haikouensis]|uniref:Uncharacterized protein n=1 Tax=Micromonospora haikouensis TaxID=686309 RepID=A0A1C4W9D1_9ACTN|nr:hypothetical protein GA0070558_11424 [Micromonospora haikouensis]